MELALGVTIIYIQMKIGLVKMLLNYSKKNKLKCKSIIEHFYKMLNLISKF